MNPRHHLGEATLLSYAAGALPTALAVVAAAHLSVCSACRRQLRLAERIGGGLVDMQRGELPAQQAREAILARLDEPPAPAGASMFPPATVADDPDALPLPLQPYFGTSLRTLRWRWLAPGVHCIRARVSEGNLLMLRIAPGKSMPVHGHNGSELTQILRGAYDDQLGHFAAGDMADLDDGIEHQPVTAAGVACICVAGLDATLRFDGWFARALQPLFGL